jgi:hypothetical protein
MKTFISASLIAVLAASSNYANLIEKVNLTNCIGAIDFDAVNADA